MARSACRVRPDRSDLLTHEPPRHGRAGHGHPRLGSRCTVKAWMAANQVRPCRVPGEVRLGDRVDVSDFGAWQAMVGEGPSLPIEPCDGSLKLSKTFSGCMLDYFSGNRTWGTAKS
jgi:hypothetical protein